MGVYEKEIFKYSRSYRIRFKDEELIHVAQNGISGKGL